MNSRSASRGALSLLAPLSDPRKAIRGRAARVLASRAGGDSRVRAALWAGLASEDQSARFACAFALADSCPPSRTRRLAAVLCDSLDAQDSDQRWAAAAALVRLGRAAGAGRRLSEMTHTGSPRARRMALYCLRDLPGRHRCALGAAAARDQESGVRLAALAMLAARGRGCARCAAIVCGLLEGDPSAGVRRAAAAALGRIGVDAPPIVSALGRAARSADSGLARAGRGALARLGSG